MTFRDIDSTVRALVEALEEDDADNAKECTIKIVVGLLDCVGRIAAALEDIALDKSKP